MITITLKYKYLKHDIDQWTYRLAGTRIENEEIRNDAQSSEIDSDVSFFRRLLISAVSAVKVLLSDRVTKVYETTNSDLSLTGDYAIELKDDGVFAPDSKSLANLLHQFVVMNVLCQWASIYSADSLQKFAADMSQLEKLIKNELYNLELPIKNRRKILTENVEISYE